MARQNTAAILARLRSMLEAQGMTPGAKLPDERALSAALGCSRQTLRQALFTLESEGAIWRHVGKVPSSAPGRPAARSGRPYYCRQPHPCN